MIHTHGHEHPLGDDWRGFHDIDPSSMTRERVLDMLARTDPQAVLDVVPHGSPQEIARRWPSTATRDCGCRRSSTTPGWPASSSRRARPHTCGKRRTSCCDSGGRAGDRRLDADELLADAQAATGCGEWGDPTFPDRFRGAVDVIRAGLVDPGGEGAAAVNCSWLLTDRLRFMADHECLGLEAEPVEHPLFVTGAPRSGTTLLHALLSVDPAARALRFWEVMHPSPPPGPARADDPRRDLADAEWRAINEKLSAWLVCHPYNDMLGNGLPECERTWAFDFRVLTPTAWWRVPMGMVVGGLPADPHAQYAIHRKMLQAIQHGRPERRWVLKGFHGPRLDALFATYPDAASALHPPRSRAGDRLAHCHGGQPPRGTRR